MAHDTPVVEKQVIVNKTSWRGGSSGGAYGLGFLGALFYFLQHATTLNDAILGIIKAIIWPAILVYHLLGSFGPS